MSGEGSPTVSTNKSWDRTPRTRVGNDSVISSFAVPRDGRRFHGVSPLSSSENSLARTPRTRPLIWASRTRASTSPGVIRRTEARKAHWSGYGVHVSSTNTELPCCRGPSWKGSAIRLPNPPRGMVSWLGKSRSYEAIDSSCRCAMVSVMR